MCNPAKNEFSIFTNKDNISQKTYSGYIPVESNMKTSGDIIFAEYLIVNVRQKSAFYC